MRCVYSHITKYTVFDCTTKRGHVLLLLLLRVNDLRLIRSILRHFGHWKSLVLWAHLRWKRDLHSPHLRYRKNRTKHIKRSIELNNMINQISLIYLSHNENRYLITVLNWKGNISSLLLHNSQKKPFPLHVCTMDERNGIRKRRQSKRDRSKRDRTLIYTSQPLVIWTI